MNLRLHQAAVLFGILLAVASFAELGIYANANSPVALWALAALEGSIWLTARMLGHCRQIRVREICRIAADQMVRDVAQAMETEYLYSPAQRGNRRTMPSYVRHYVPNGGLTARERRRNNNAR